ncbi:hypothetical protein [Campylobacter concisus]|jgi:hypothetical protein|uniref:hypothetical protein n=1 Tax=Campylobacter concisus TaxID=199 RepID=UPI0011E67966|nr:hypothetical protein [Campylobacter concisus]
MKRFLFLSLLFIVFSNAQNLSIETYSKDNKCSISINDEKIYSRECEYELEPNLIFYTKVNRSEVWIFQDIQNYSACSGHGPLRIFEKKDDDKIKFQGEIDWCASVPLVEVTNESILIIDKPRKNTLTNNGDPNFKSSGKRSDERKYKFENGKIKKI